MMKVRKKLFTLSGLFMVLAQVFVAAFCGITAIAITKDETTKNLFDVNGSSATMAYELVDNDTIKWTVSLKKGAYDSPTRFMVDLVAGESSVVPEQIQSTNQEMVFESNYGDEYIQGGFSEQVTGSMSGEATISFVTTRQISNLVVTPKLVTVPATNEAVTMVAAVTADSTVDAEAEVQPTVASEPVNLLENVPNVNFDIPAVEEEEENNTVVPETPAAEGETEVGTEAPVDATGNGEVGNQDAVTEEPEQEVEGTDSGSAASTLFQGFSTFAGIQATADVDDPFQYTSDGDGSHPTHGTNQYSHDGATPIRSSDDISNYNYGSSDGKTDNVSLFNIDGEGLDFRNGYHEHGNSTTGQINTKKTVMPTSDENIFQIQLDTIGDAIRPFPEVDIVLVLDRSGSMTTKTGDENSDTRWEQLQQAVDKFSKDILSENNNGESRIQIGLVGFYSKGHTEKKDGKDIHVIDYMGADTSRFTTTLNGNNVTSGFSSSPEAIVKHPIVTSELETSGTPTFIGVDAGIDLLKNGEGARPKAKKVMITITDGLPTFIPGTNYSFTANSTTKIENTNYFQYTTKQYSGDGSAKSGSDEEKSYNTATINHINAAYSANTGIQYCGVGFHMDANSVLKALGPNDQTYVASKVNELTNALKQSVVRAIYTIGNATLNDPMSEYVKFVNYDETTKIKTEGLYLKDGVLTPGSYNFTTGIEPKFDEETNQIIATGVSLGQEEENGRQGCRITYKVELKEEYRDGNFYPTNGTTYLANGERGNHYYAVPSVRIAPTPVNVSFTKTNGTDGLKGAQFVLLQAGQTKYTSNVTGGNGGVTFTNVLPGAYVLRETQTPDGHITMADVNVIVTRDGKITQEDGETILGTVVNTRKLIDISLNKVGPDGETPLVGATFELQQNGEKKATFAENETTAGLHELAGVLPGTYDLVETDAPEGYEVLGKIGVLTIDEYGTATFTKTGGSPQDVERDAKGSTIKLSLPTVKNNLKPIALRLNKLGADGNTLGGAIFELQQSGEKKATLTETADGLHELVGVAPGTYELVETNSPDGYKVLGKIGDLKIDSAGNAGFKKVGETEYTDLDRTVNNRINITLPTVINELKPFELEVKKRNADNHNQFLQGAVFTLYDKTPTDDTATELAKVTTDSNGKGTFKKTDGSIYQLEAGQEYFFKETTAPDGYVLSTSIYKVVIAIDGSVAITKDGNTVTEATADLIPDNGNNQIGLTIDNKPKTPLPSTGGSGTMFFVTIGVLGLLSTALYFLQRKDQEVA